MKSKIEKIMLIRKKDEMFLSIKFPINITGNEKNKDKNKGIITKANGISILKDSSKVKE
tara:strand:+ start:7806 stop:7982 length:177 start_codon:yes stop_codon:yes gene_type:complete